MTGDTDLQRQCQELLHKLKQNQITLQQGFVADSQHILVDNNLELHCLISGQKPQYARQKLRSIMKQKNGGFSTAVCDIRPTVKESDSQSLQMAVNSKVLPQTEKCELLNRGEKKSASRFADQGNSESLAKGSLVEGVTDHLGNACTHGKPTPRTPVSVRRQLIDRNVHVDSRLSGADLELDNTRGLNFSYSQNMDDDDATIETSDIDGSGNTNQNSAVQDEAKDDPLAYHRSLMDRGNNRQLNNFIKDTTIKPKSKLNSTQTFSSSYNKQEAGVNVQNTSGNLLFQSQVKDRHLLGYDWIAALIQNDASLLDESESYFQELREFRRHNRDECCNDFYMEGPFTLTQTEPPAIEEAIKDTKVEAFTVNERLFTVPLTENLLGEPLDTDAKWDKREPTEDNPRVSIPRSTLQMPYKVRPHRRHSFDASDSCSLSEHCLMGWNAAVPATLPTASSVSLTDALAGVNPKHATTMAEAEKVASTFHWPLLTAPSQPRTDASLPLWRKQYLHPDFTSLSLSSSVGDVAGSSNFRRKTDKLLNSTYCMMYEMQKAREHKELEKLQQTGKASS